LQGRSFARSTRAYSPIGLVLHLRRRMIRNNSKLPFAPLASKHLPWPTPLGSGKQNAASPRPKS